jgi:signal transduction histidine kinase
MDLYLFYKECLTNIIRHSGSTSVSTQIHVTKKEIRLIVTDNGCGTANKVPPSLKRRARFLGAKIQAGVAHEGGTIITLIVKSSRLTFKQ